jgi:hypothetical protein
LGRREEKKRDLMGAGTDSFMVDWKCRFCGHDMDEYAETFEDGEYTRTTSFRCINKDCPGLPKSVNKEKLIECLESSIKVHQEWIQTHIKNENFYLAAGVTAMIKVEKEIIDRIKKGEFDN